MLKTFSALLMAAATPIASAQTATFIELPDAWTISDLSPDGRWLVGNLDGGGGLPGATYRYDRLTDTMLPLPAEGLAASAVSDDGTIVLGDVPDPTFPDGNIAGLWTAADGWQSIGFLPNAGTCPSRSDGYELSADGTVAVGLSWEGCDGRAFVWTAGEGMEELQVLGLGGNRASVLSSDGVVVGGFAHTATADRTPAVWDATTLTGQLLDPSGAALGEVRGISDDGATLLGVWNGQAFRWTDGDGAEVLGSGSVLPGWIGNAMDVADDGTVVGFDALFGQYRGWIQPQGAGPLLPLREWVEAHGGTVPDGATLDRPSAISADGRVITGHSWPNTGGWIVLVEAPCPADVTGDGAIGVDDLVAVITSWGPCPGCPADVTGDGEVGVDDLVAVITAWGACP